MSGESTRMAVDRLLRMYGEYRRLGEQLAQAERALMRAKLAGSDTTTARATLDALRTQQQTISDAMTFATPLIWVMYKCEAYRDEAQPIATLHDFRLHCAKPGYICTKRLHFLNQWCQRRGRTPFSDTGAYPDEMRLEELYAELAVLEQDASLMEEWRRHEYYQENGAVKKWQNADDE
ncbi:MAG: hypothetical protein Q4B05_02380 [Candidatus Saccharibacteria bacterium]|nr:hypothetical protein [Candidatus Saccharibacteria bacterium]